MNNGVKKTVKILLIVLYIFTSILLGAGYVGKSPLQVPKVVSQFKSTMWALGSGTPIQMNIYINAQETETLRLINVYMYNNYFARFSIGS